MSRFPPTPHGKSRTGPTSQHNSLSFGRTKRMATRTFVHPDGKYQYSNLSHQLASIIVRGFDRNDYIGIR